MHSWTTLPPGLLQLDIPELLKTIERRIYFATAKLVVECTLGLSVRTVLLPDSEIQRLLSFWMISMNAGARTLFGTSGQLTFMHQCHDIGRAECKLSLMQLW